MSLFVFARSSHALLKDPSALLTSCALGSLRLYPPLEMDSVSYESMAAPIAPEPDKRAIRVTPTTAVRASVESRKDDEADARATGRGTLRNSKSQRQKGSKEIASLRGSAEAPLCGSNVYVKSILRPSAETRWTGGKRERIRRGCVRRDAIALASILTDEAYCQSYDAKEAPFPVGDQCSGIKAHCLEQDQDEEDDALLEAEREQESSER